MAAFTNPQLRNAITIYKVGRGMGASARDIQIALITAMQESGLINLNYGDRDSRGLFQQRPSMGWGSPDQVTDPVYSARAFFRGAGTNKGLLDYGNRRTMSMAAAAQQVQRSAFPDAYSKHINLVKSMFGKVEHRAGGTPLTPQDTGIPTQLGAEGKTAPDELPLPEVEQTPATSDLGVQQPSDLGVNQPGFDPEPDLGNLDDIALPQMDPDTFDRTFDGMKQDTNVSGWRADVIATAKKYLGDPYVWGGAKPGGFDCSGIIQYAFAKAGLDMPRVSFQQANQGKRTSIGALSPGDLVAWDNSSRNNGADHIALFLGNGQILEAPRTGLNLRIRKVRANEGAWGVKLNF